MNKLLIIVVLLLISCGKMSEYEALQVEIPSERVDRYENREYLEALSVIGEDKREILESYLSFNSMTGTPVRKGLTIGKAIAIQEETVLYMWGNRGK